MRNFRHSFRRRLYDAIAHFEHAKRLFRRRETSTVLIIRTDGIGDFILWLPSVSAIRSKYPSPEYKLVLVVPHDIRDLAVSFGVFDRVISFHRTKFFENIFYASDFIKQIGKLRADIAINPQISRDVKGDRFIRASGARQTIGSDGNRDPKTQSLKKMRMRSLWYTDLINGPAGAHELQSNAAFADHFFKGARPSYPKIPSEAFVVPEWLPREDFFVIHVGAGASAKKWPLDRFVELANKVHVRTGWTAVICGSAFDAPDCAELADRLSGHSLNACGNSSLREICGLLSKAKLAIGNDSGAAHIAAAVGCHAVVPFGGWHFGRFMPYPDLGKPILINPVFKKLDCFDCGWMCKFGLQLGKPFHCLNNITVDDVWDAVIRVIPNALQSAQDSYSGASTTTGSAPIA